MHSHGDDRVNLCSSDLFKHGCPFVGRGLKESCKTALGQQHGSGELLKIHSRSFHHCGKGILQFRFDNFAGCILSNLMLLSL